MPGSFVNIPHLEVFWRIWKLRGGWGRANNGSLRTKHAKPHRNKFPNAEAKSRMWKIHIFRPAFHQNMTFNGTSNFCILAYGLIFRRNIYKNRKHTPSILSASHDNLLEILASAPSPFPERRSYSITPAFGLAMRKSDSTSQAAHASRAQGSVESHTEYHPFDHWGTCDSIPAGMKTISPSVAFFGESTEDRMIPSLPFNRPNTVQPNETQIQDGQADTNPGYKQAYTRFLESLREEGIELYAFIDSMILHGHLDSLRLREVLEYRPFLGEQLRDSPVTYPAFRGPVDIHRQARAHGIQRSVWNVPTIKPAGFPLSSRDERGVFSLRQSDWDASESTSYNYPFDVDFPVSTRITDSQATPYTIPPLAPAEPHHIDAASAAFLSLIDYWPSDAGWTSSLNKEVVRQSLQQGLLREEELLAVVDWQRLQKLATTARALHSRLVESLFTFPPVVPPHSSPVPHEETSPAITIDVNSSTNFESCDSTSHLSINHPDISGGRPAETELCMSSTLPPNQPACIAFKKRKCYDYQNDCTRQWWMHPEKDVPLCDECGKHLTTQEGPSTVKKIVRASSDARQLWKAGTQNYRRRS
ncbi:hypothetical protein R3P38DRAFT_2775495 [Favolaschia claudopus]|uniref:Uncharacterized protein n=1 Tax=Favolaschia claudopus TaxID=2862362 RepID=A0AAW0BTW3_9AGAR